MILKVKYKLTVVLSLILLLFILIGSVSAADNTTNVIDNINTTSNSATVNNSLDVVTFNDYHNENLNQTISNQVLSNTYTENSTNNNNVFFSNQTIENNKQNTVLGISNDEISTLNSANPIYISPEGIGTGQSIDSPTTWNNAINDVNNGGIIYFLDGEYTNILNQTINKNITLTAINIGAAIINAQGKGYIFNNTENNTLNITGLTFVNGTGCLINIEGDDCYYGGAIYSEGILNVKDSTFTNNTATDFGNGGAICMGNGTVINSTFIGNTATGSSSGGAICMGNGTVINSTFTANTAYTGGGAIYIPENGNGTVINSNFINNTATQGGGAIYILENGTVINSTFIGNNATSSDSSIISGGAIYTTNGNVINSIFIGNTAKSNGGAISISNNGNVSDSTFIGNNASDGGAIYTGTGNLIVSNSSFINNTANSGGGAIDTTNGNVTVSGSSFINSTASKGGAIYTGTGNVTVSGSSFINSTASKGGAIYTGTGNVTVSGSSFINSTVTLFGGGAIYTGNGTVTVSGSSFIKNTAGSGGGAIYTGTGNVTVSGSSFINNTATNNGCGGAIYTGTGNVTLCNSSFINNTASNVGGAIYLNTGNVNVSGSSFINNTATLFGGVILTSTGNVNVSGSSFINNTANSGGAIYLNTGNVNVSGSVLIGNNATKGCAIYISPDGAVVADYDWWGNNTPFDDKSNNNLIYKTFNYVSGECLVPSNWVIMGLNLSSTNISTSGSSVLVASLNQVNTSSGVVSSLPEGIVLPNRTVIFSANGGTLNPVIGNISSNASSIYTSTTKGTYTLSSTIDNQTLSINVLVSDNTPTPSSKSTSITDSELSCYENGTVVVHVLDEDSIVDTGSINLFYNNSAIGTGYVHNGEAVINITGLEPGNYSVIAFYFGKDPFDSASKTLNLTVLPVTPVVDENITINVPSINGKPGSNTTVTINVTGSNGTIVNTGNITITINGENYTAKVVNGTVNLNITLPGSVGVNNITVTYTNGSYSTSVNSTILVTNDTGLINTVLVGYNLTKTYGTLANYTGKLTDSLGNPISGQHIALNLTRLSTGQSKVYWVTTDTNGEFQLEINLIPGNYTAQASYNGNDYYASSNASVNSIIVNNPSNLTSTTLVADSFNHKVNAGLNFTGKLFVTDSLSPISGQHIALNLTRLSNGQSKVYWVTTDTLGEFQLPINLSIGNYRASCSYTGTSTYTSSSDNASIIVK